MILAIGYSNGDVASSYNGEDGEDVDVKEAE